MGKTFCDFDLSFDCVDTTLKRKQAEKVVEEKYKLEEAFKN